MVFNRLRVSVLCLRHLDHNDDENTLTKQKKKVLWQLHDLLISSYSNAMELWFISWYC